MSSTIAARDGTSDMSGGVNGIAVTTLVSPMSPGGLHRNETAWMINATCRDGGITQRSGWIRIGKVYGAEGLFQGKFMYEPLGAFPYELWSVSGNILKVDLDTGAVVNLSQQANLYNNPTAPHAYFVQAEEFAIIQSGDGTTLPLIWDGTTLRRSNGITGNVGQPSATVYNITTTGFRTVPAVGGSQTWPLSAMYPGAVNDIGEMRRVGGQTPVGTFEVTAFTAVAPFTVTLETISSPWIGFSFAPGDYTFTLTAVPVPVLINEIPAATAMCYYMDRIWYAQGRIVSAGDLVFGTSGTAAYGYRDSVLKVTENPLAVGGDGFPVPAQNGTIRALQYGANIDAALGQGRLFIFTIKAVYALQVPVNRDDWIDAGANNQPLMTVVQLANGSVNDRSVVAVNGDLFYQSLEPGIRSLMQSMRSFTQWGNTSISANENRILQFNDRSLLHASSGMFFNNRLFQTSLPRETPQGVVHDVILPFDVLPVSTFGQERKPNWEGSQEGMPIFQMLTGDFGGRERAFAAVQAEDGSLEVWEISQAEKFDYALEPSEETRRVRWRVEFPSFTWADTIGEQELKKLVGAWIWVDSIFGTVEFQLSYIPDSATCPIPWISWTECSPKNTAELMFVPPGYPVKLGPCYRNVMAIPKPPENCAPCGIGRPAWEAFQFQPILEIKGYCRIRGIWLWAEGPREISLYPVKSLVC